MQPPPDSALQLQTQLGISNDSDRIPEIISYMSTIPFTTF